MSLSTDIFEDEIDPIDLVEHLAAHRDWAFDRVDQDQIAMAIQGQWREYSVTLAWSVQDETLRLVTTFEVDPPADKQPAFYELLNLINEQCWMGAFTYWAAQKRIVYRYGLTLSGAQEATPEQIDAMIDVSIRASECYYPAMQLLIWGDETPQTALQIAIAQGYGRA